jgi:hypothetical protein
MVTKPWYVNKPVRMSKRPDASPVRTSKKNGSLVLIHRTSKNRIAGILSRFPPLACLPHRTSCATAPSSLAPCEPPAGNSWLHQPCALSRCPSYNHVPPRPPTSTAPSWVRPAYGRRRRYGTPQSPATRGEGAGCARSPTVRRGSIFYMDVIFLVSGPHP